MDWQTALFFCARRFGKSYLSIILALEYCLKHPNSIVRVAAATYKQIQDIVEDNMSPIILDAPKGLITREKSSNRYKVGSSSLRLGCIERAHVDTLRGGDADFVILEEGGSVKSDDYKYALRSVLGPQLLRTNGAVLHVTTPSEEEDHIIHESILPKCELSETSFVRDIYANTALSQEQIEAAIEMAGGEDSEEWQREFLCKIIRPKELTILPEYSDDLVVEIELPPYHTPNTFIDFGGVMDKTVALAVTYDFKKNKVLVLDERSFPPNTDTGTIVKETKQMEANLNYNPEMRYIDAPGQLLIDLINTHQFNCCLPDKDDWQASINSLRVAIKNKSILISHNCKLLIQTCKSGRFNKTRKDFARTEALGHMDAVATLMYANRMVDRYTNPYPEDYHDRDTEVVIKRDRESDTSAKLADMLTKTPDYKKILRKKR